MLENMGQEAGGAINGLKALLVQRLYGDFFVPQHFAVEIAQRQAAFFKPLLFLRSLHDFRIDEDEVVELFRCIAFLGTSGEGERPAADHEEPEALAYLRRGDSHAVFFGMESLFHPGDDSERLGGADFFGRERFGDRSQDRRFAVHQQLFLFGIRH